MIRRLAFLLLFSCSAAHAQFNPGQILTAAQLNSAFANVLGIAGGTLTGPLTVPALTVTGDTIVSNLTVNGTLTASGVISPSSLAPQIPNSLIGNVSNSTQSPGVVGLPSGCNSNTSALNYAYGAGFICNNNVNASTLGGQTFAAPGPIGSSVASTGSFTNLTASGTVTLPSGSVALSNLATQAANTMVANVTGSTASPTAVAIPSCSTANSALQFTSGTGLACGTTFALTGGTLAQFAATTSAQLAGVISNETGSGALVFGTNPTLAGPTVTGTLAASAITASSTITPSSTAGIVGTATNDSANAGSVGEFLSNTTSSVSLSNGTMVNGTSVSLTAGDWDCHGTVAYTVSVGASVLIAGISTTTSALSAITSGFGAYEISATSGTPYGSTFAPLTTTRISIASTTTVYLVVQANFASGTVSTNSFIGCRRAR